MSVPTQLVLPVGRQAEPTFDTFLGAGNREVVARLRDIAVHPQVCRLWLVGGAGFGKSHLLGALAAATRSLGRGAAEALLAGGSVDDLRALAGVATVLVDSVDAVCGDARWEAALLQLCNEQRGAIVFTAACHPAEAGIDLPDLRTRLAAAEVYRLASLLDADRLILRAARARTLGIDLPEDVAAYLLARLPRDAGTLSAAIDALDLAAWREQRRLTVPFVRAVLPDLP